ncbi:MAG TPA: DUF2971 domain-containing protein [Acidobacteriaceae bacterium]
MITPVHEKDGFFKYYTASSAKITLRSASRKWSTPPLFNDPFDNQFDLHLEEHTADLVKQSLCQFIETITSSQPLNVSQFAFFSPVIEMIRQVHMQNPDLQYTEDELAELREGVIEGMQQATKINPETNAKIRAILADITIFCVSETHDNLLMWSHYAQRHTGIAIKFLSLPEVDSPIILARPVRYMKQMPRLTFAALMDLDATRKYVFDYITLTKNDAWAYEKEWRIVTSLRDKTRSFEILPFAPEEIGAVYLGCSMAIDDKHEIIQIARGKYPNAKIFEAIKHEREFALVFREIT